MNPIFAPGDRVQLRSDRSRVGTIIRERSRSGGLIWYQVQFLDGSQETLCEPDLDRFAAAVSPQELFARGAFGDHDDLLRTVTFQKLDTPLDNTLYSLRASRTEFYPHQYKPLIKFLDSKSQRLLIADEVGLGKTIEAGLILVELRARRALQQALVVCPSALRYKWKEEMWRRFDEEFRILSSSDFADLVEQLQERGSLGELRAIVSLESTRRESIVELLEATPLPLDLLIIDEAHHLRNSSTLSHRIGAALADSASAVVLLTATPIHLGSENLFNLFRILDPEEFEDLFTFEDRLQANEPVIEAERLLLSAFPPPLDDVQQRVDRMAAGGKGRYFVDNPLFDRLQTELTCARAGGVCGRGDVARMHQDLKDLNLLSHIFTRTRKREVFSASAKREPLVVRPAITPEEIAFYQAVTRFVRSRSGVDAAGAAGMFASITAQRQVASSMQAARARFVERALDDLSDAESSDVLDCWEVDPERMRDTPLSLPEQVIACAEALGSIDSKFQALIDTLRELERVEPGRKVLIFSYFRDTLAYVTARLRLEGFSCELIHGDVKSDPRRPDRDERAQRMHRFRDPAGPQILLSSEVGSEGLDFQFCHILVNYDLPWNPMRVEQRIGRLDRLGQESKRIVIVNLTLPGTIEDRILQRLYSRIGIFERSIGDLEAILGEEIQQLTRALLTRDLTVREEEALIDRAAAVIESRRVLLESLESQSSRFVGCDFYFEEQLERARNGGEMLSSEDLRSFTARFLAQAYPKSRLRPAEAEGVHWLDVDPALHAALHSRPDDATKFRFLHRLNYSAGRVKATFDAECAFLDDEVEFLAAHHPLLRLAVQHYRDRTEEIHPVSALNVHSADLVAPDTYLFALFRVEIQTGRTRRRLDPVFLSVGTGELLPEEDGSRLLGQMLRAASAWGDVPAFEVEEARTAMDMLEDRFFERLAELRRQMADRNAAVVQTRLVSLETAHKGRLRKKQALLENARRDRRQERYIRMLEGTIRNMAAQYEERRTEIEAERQLSLTSKMVGCGILRVEA